MPMADVERMSFRSATDAPASGGLTNQLMVVSVTTYSDDNGNSTMDSTEMQTTLTTKIAKSVNYATKASS